MGARLNGLIVAGGDDEVVVPRRRMHLPSVLLRPLVQGDIPRCVQAVLLRCCKLRGDTKITIQ